MWKQPSFNFAILDSSGNGVVYYEYDAWGNHTISGSNISLGNVNPFRYRGYYYDAEFGLYYLQSRYYDPELGRFISADDVSYLAPDSIFGLNLYAYCGNNPVMNIDPSGCSLLAILLILGVATITGAAIGAKKAADEGKEGWDFAKSVLLGGAIGLAVGGAFLAVSGVTVGAIFGASKVVLGVTATQMFAIGAAAFNTSAFLFGPLLGFEMEGIEFETPEPIYTPPVLNPLPPHPSQKNRRYK